MKKYCILLLITLSTIVFCSKETIPVKQNTEKAPLCKINDIEFKTSDFSKFLDDHRIPESALLSRKDQILANFLDLFIEQKIIELKIKNEKIAVDSKELESIMQNSSGGVTVNSDGYQESMRRDILLQKYLLLKLLPRLSLTDQEVQDYYDQHRNGFIMTERIKIMQIILPNKEDADNLYAKLTKSPKLLPQLIEKKTLDEIQTKGIVVSTYQKGELPKDIEEHLWSLPVGILDKPLTNESGDCMIFKVLQKHPQGLAPLEEVKDKIEKKLALIKFDQMSENLKEELRKSSHVVIYKNNLNFIYSGKYLTETKE